LKPLLRNRASGWAGRLVTGPAAFFVATVIDVAVYLVGRAPQSRLGRR
jgi:hypothetical protein